MAVLLLYPLQLAVNTVKAVPPVHVYVSVFMFAGALLFLAASPTLAVPPAGLVLTGRPGRFPHPVPDPEQQSVPPPPPVCVMPEEALRTGTDQAVAAGQPSRPP